MKKIIIIVLPFLLLVGGGAAYLLSTDDAEQARDHMAEMSEQSTEVPQEQQVPPAQGSYVNYSGGVIENTTGTKLLFFHAPWCPQCRALDADITAQGVPEGVTIFKVDYDTNQALRQKYGVTIQTTLVRVDDSGALVEKYVAYDEPTLESIEQNLL